MLIILEGVDGAGKSTFAEELRTLMAPARFGHLGPPESPDTALDECLDMLGDYRAEDMQDVVLDRLHWGSPVYGPIYRPESNADGYGDMGQHGWRYAEMVIAARGGINVFVDVDPAVARERIAERGDDYVDVDDLDELVAKYHRIAEEALQCSPVNGASTAEAREQELFDTIAAARIAQHHAAQLAPWPSYVGTVAPCVLVLMPPDRQQRLAFLKLIGDEWRHIGIASSAMPAAEVVNLVDRLGGPKLLVLASSRPGPEYAHAAGAVLPRGDDIRYMALEDLAVAARTCVHANLAAYF